MQRSLHECFSRHGTALAPVTDACGHGAFGARREGSDTSNISTSSFPGEAAKFPDYPFFARDVADRRSIVVRSDSPSINSFKNMLFDCAIVEVCSHDAFTVKATDRAGNPWLSVRQ